MSTTVLGWTLVIIGIVCIVAGIGGGIARMFIEIKKDLTGGKSFAEAGGINLPTELLKALTEFLTALIKAPAWLALVILGILFVAWGGTMV